jgi:putative nucleotidyltransferase with HDIG domain
VHKLKLAAAPEDAAGAPAAAPAAAQWAPPPPDAAPLTPAAAVDCLFALFDAHGASDYIGEAVSAVEHATQAAAAAAAAAAPPAVVAGALLHDIGHLIGLAAPPGRYDRMGDCGIMAHEGIGAALLDRLGFPPVTSAVVRRHVDAKRYLCGVDPGYHARLSDASKTTLTYQGGPMTHEEAAAFAADPLSPTILAMRTWDEAAKVPGAAVPPLGSYRGMLEGLVAGGAGAGRDA